MANMLARSPELSFQVIKLIPLYAISGALCDLIVPHEGQMTVIIEVAFPRTVLVLVLTAD